MSLQLDGEVLNDRLVIYADTLALGLRDLADALDAVNPLVLVNTGKTPGSVVRDLAVQLAQAATALPVPEPKP